VYNVAVINDVITVRVIVWLVYRRRRWTWSVWLRHKVDAPSVLMTQRTSMPLFTPVNSEMLFHCAATLHAVQCGHARRALISYLPNLCLTTSGSGMGSDQSAVRSSFGCVLSLNQIYLTTMCRSAIPLRFILSVCDGN